SGLTVADAKVGIELAEPRLEREVVDDQAYWLSAAVSDASPPSPTAWLLPPYDEYTVVGRQQPGRGRRRARIRHRRGEPVRLVVDDLPLQARLGQLDPHFGVGDGQPRPPREVLQGRRSVAHEVAPGQLGERFVARQRPGRRN